jgi:hypothetical protein
MQSQMNFRQINSTAKQLGVIACVWLAINSLGHSDRTPEGYFSSGSREGSGYA